VPDAHQPYGDPEMNTTVTNAVTVTCDPAGQPMMFATFRSDHRADLADLRTPALILQCSDDIVAPHVVGEYVHEHTPRSALLHLDATGHGPNLSAPEETVAAIKAYL
jgi:sigma-B regulation protein RsbQ